jgi:Mg/Co/Ni transporter MgtE
VGRIRLKLNFGISLDSYSSGWGAIEGWYYRSGQEQCRAVITVLNRDQWKDGCIPLDKDQRKAIIVALGRDQCRGVIVTLDKDKWKAVIITLDRDKWRAVIITLDRDRWRVVIFTFYKDRWRAVIIVCTGTRAELLLLLLLSLWTGTSGGLF